MRKLSLISLAGLLFLGACSSSKDLTEKTARNLLQEEARATSHLISLSQITPLMNRTRNDYTQTANNQAEATLKELLAQKLVVQKVDTVAYPRIAGRFTMRVDYKLAPGQFRQDEFTLESVPNSNKLTGNFVLTITNEVNNRSRVDGEVSPDGQVTLHLLDAVSDERLQYVEEGPNAYLRYNTGQQLAGVASHEKTEVKWYTYLFSPEMQKQIVQRNGTMFLEGGKYNIGDVSQLQLGYTDTEATASFVWIAPTNDVARILTQSKEESGTGHVSFGKKPDGTWFVKRWCAGCACTGGC